MLQGLLNFESCSIGNKQVTDLASDKMGELYLQGEAATGKISLLSPVKGREFHLFCSEHNAGAIEFAEELKVAPVFETKGRRASAPLTKRIAATTRPADVVRRRGAPGISTGAAAAAPYLAAGTAGACAIFECVPR